MTDLIDEVIEDIKEKKDNYLTQKIIKIFSICAVIVIVATAIYAWKERSVEKMQYRQSILLTQAITAADNNKFDEAIISLDKVIEYSHQQYAAIAYLNKAAILMQQNKFDQAQESLLAMIGNQYLDPSFKDLARVVFLGNQLHENKLKSDQTDEFLNKITQDNSLWKMSGLQLQALYDMKRGKADEAKVSLNKILKDPKANKASLDLAAIILAITSKGE